MNGQSSGYCFGLHLWSVVTVVAALPLLLAGGTVTTFRWGMVDDTWPTSPWFLLANWSEAMARGLAFVAEHGHRQLGWLIGGMTIVLACWTWLTSNRRLDRFQNWLALTCLVGVALQGLLGGLRVLYEVPVGRELAMLHGIIGQVVFTLLVAMATVLSPNWLAGETVSVSGRKKMLRLAGLTLGLLIAQLVVGVWLRQAGGRTSWPIVVHLVLAAGILFHSVLLYVKSQSLEPSAYRYLRWPAFWLAVLAGIQVLFGMGSWMLGGGDGGISREISPERALVATGHMLIGAMLLAASAMMALRIAHHLKEGVSTVPIPSPLGSGGRP